MIIRGVGLFLIIISSKVEGSILIEFFLWGLRRLGLSIRFFVDEIRLMFVGVIGLIRGSVLTYRRWYINDEIFFNRFIGLVLAFVGSMYFLIFIPNLVILLIGWDGLGLTSFLLVCYYQNRKSLSAGIITALTNRVGDVLILVCISLIVNEGRFLVYGVKRFWVSLLFVVCLIFGGMTKSAQIPFCAWLPAAMAAPTPVSSLVHSSTLVTAGVYLLIRSYYFLSQSEIILIILKILSIFTLVLAGRRAIFCLDIKKVIALSTLRQLRVIIFALSCGMVVLSFFHLVIHAVFKALLFLSAGVVIHSCNRNQDVRILGGCWRIFPVSISFMFVSNLSLCGFPFVSGFYSKDIIVDYCYRNIDSFITFCVFLLGLLFTGLYRFRIIWMTLFSLNKVYISVVKRKEALELSLAYIFLGFGAIFLGVIIRGKMEKLCGYRSCSVIEMEFLLFIAFVGVISLFFFVDVVRVSKFVVSYFIGIWFLERLTAYGLSLKFISLCKSLNLVIDKGFLEILGPQGLYESFIKSRKVNEEIQSRYFMNAIFLIFSIFSVFVFACYFIY